MAISRYLIENEGSDENSARIALNDALKRCEAEAIASIVFVVPKKSDLPDVLTKLLGDVIAKELQKTGVVQSNPSLELQSAKTLNPNRTYGLVFAFHAAKASFDVIDSISSAKALYVLPWVKAEGLAWGNTWGPTVVGPNTWNTTRSSLPAPVEAELKRVASIINISQGLANSSDKAEVKRCFQTLRAAGHAVDPTLIRSWALQNGWRPKHANELQHEATMAWT